MKTTKKLFKKFVCSRIDFSTITNILSSFKVVLSKHKLKSLSRYLNSGIDVKEEEFFKRIPSSLDEKIRKKIFKKFFELKIKLKRRSEKIRSDVTNHLKIMNIFTNHIYNFINLHFLRACQELSEDNPYDPDLVDYIPVINEQFIRYISQGLYGYSEAKSKRKTNDGTIKRKEKIKSLKNKIANWKGKKGKKFQKMIEKLGKLEMLDDEFYVKLPERLRASLDATKNVYIAGLGVEGKKNEKRRESIFPKIYGLSMIVNNKITQIQTNVMNMFKFTTYSLCKRYLKWEFRNSKTKLTKSTIHKVIMGEYSGEILSLQKFKEILEQKKNFLKDAADFRSMLLLRYKILKKFSEHNQYCLSEKNKSGKEKQIKLFSLFPMKQTFAVDYILYDKESVVFYFKKFLTEKELAVFNNIDKKDLAAKANYIFEKLLNFDHKKDHELINFSTDGLGVS